MRSDTIITDVLVTDDGGDALVFTDDVCEASGEVYLGVLREGQQYGVLLTPYDRRLVAAKLLEGLKDVPEPAPLPIDDDTVLTDEQEQRLEIVGALMMQSKIAGATVTFNIDEAIEVMRYIEEGASE